MWLYGSRARGEAPGEDSDIDVLVISSQTGHDDHLRAIQLAVQAAMDTGVNAALISVKVYTPAEVADRRRIRSFFFREVDRDKIVLAGRP